MAITLDPDTERRIQRQVDRGSFSDTRELLSHALDVVEAQEDWLLRNKDAINEGLDKSFAEAARGEGFSLEEIEAMVRERLEIRAA